MANKTETTGAAADVADPPEAVEGTIEGLDLNLEPEQDTQTPALHTETPLQAPPESITPLAIISSAVQQGADVAVLERMMDLHERLEGLESKKAFARAMSAFKANPPEIRKTKSVNYSGKSGEVSYNHSDIAEIARDVSRAMSPHGLSFRWVPHQTTGSNGQPLVGISCVVSHQDGHHEASPVMYAPPDATGSKNALQAVGSTMKYLQRYTLMAVTGLVDGDPDDDGTAAYTATGEAAEFATPEQRQEVRDLLADTQSDEAAALRHWKVDSIDVMSVQAAKYAIAQLETKRANMARETANQTMTDSNQSGGSINDHL